MTLKDIKGLFFAYRNGLIADTLRKGGISYKYIFGLNIPQLSMISNKIDSDRNELGEILWEDVDCRESRLLACRLIEPNKLEKENAIKMIRGVKTREEADILSFWLLKKLPYAKEILKLNFKEDSSITQYVLEALSRNLEN